MGEFGGFGEDDFCEWGDGDVGIFFGVDFVGYLVVEFVFKFLLGEEINFEEFQ